MNLQICYNVVFGKNGTAVSFASFLSRPLLMKETKSGGFLCPSDLLVQFVSPFSLSHSSRIALHCSSVGRTMVNNRPKNLPFIALNLASLLSALSLSSALRSRSACSSAFPTHSWQGLPFSIQLSVSCPSHQWDEQNTVCRMPECFSSSALSPRQTAVIETVRKE